MTTKPRAWRLIVPLAAAGVLAVLGFAFAAGPGGKAALTEREKAIHVLNRLGFGPRPGDVDRVLAMGVSAYVEQQLSAESLPDPAAASIARRFPTLEMTTAELYDRFERPLREARRERRSEMQRAGNAAGEDKTLHPG